MCTPALLATYPALQTAMTVAPFVMAAGGAAANYRAQQQVVGAREDVARAEGERQANLQKRASSIIDENLAKQSPADQNQQLAQAQSQRQASLLPLQSEKSGLPTSASAPVEVKGEVARQIGDAVKAGRQRLTMQARLGAGRQVQFDNNLSMNRGMSDIGQLADFSRGSSAVVPLEFQSADQKGRGARGVADLFNLGSTALSLYGMAGAGAGGGLPGRARTMTYPLPARPNLVARPVT